MSYADHIPAKEGTQAKPIAGRESQMTSTSDGCFAFKVGPFAQLNRFLVLGSEGGSYYASEKKLTGDNVAGLLACIKEDGKRTVDQIVDMSYSGRAPKNDPALLALAICASSADPETRKYALSQLPKVARIGTHLFHFLEFVNKARGWGRGLKTGVGAWYQMRTPEQLALQMVKYQQRDGWSHRDALRLAKPKPVDDIHSALYRYAAKGEINEALPPLIHAVNRINSLGTSVSDVCLLIESMNIPHECIPTQMKTDPAIWKALLPTLGSTALIRNLRNMTKYGVLVDKCRETEMAVSRLLDIERLKKDRIHPIQFLSALMAYKEGGDYTPAKEIVDALDMGFYLSFGAIEPTGKKFYNALDVSGSMTWHEIAGMKGIRPREASAVLSMVTARVEQNCTTRGFSHQMVDTGITADMTLDQVIRQIEKISMGSTDCALPFKDARTKGELYDVFVVYTDSETNHGNSRHAYREMELYNEEMNRLHPEFEGKFKCKAICVAMECNELSVFPEDSPECLQVAGFDSSTPNVISEFGRGTF